MKIKLVETRDHVLSMYDKQISEYTEKHFNRENIQLLLNKMVQRVDKNGLAVKDQQGSSSFITAGTIVWCTGAYRAALCHALTSNIFVHTRARAGIKLNPLAVSLMNKLPKEAQQNARALKTDGYLQVKGSNGSIFAMGDTATIEQDRLLELAESLFKRADTDQNGCVGLFCVRVVFGVVFVVGGGVLKGCWCTPNTRAAATCLYIPLHVSFPLPPRLSSTGRCRVRSFVSCSRLLARSTPTWRWWRTTFSVTPAPSRA